jgi:hypothetical protein
MDLLDTREQRLNGRGALTRVKHDSIRGVDDGPSCDIVPDLGERVAQQEMRREDLHDASRHSHSK